MALTMYIYGWPLIMHFYGWSLIIYNHVSHMKQGINIIFVREVEGQRQHNQLKKH